MFKLTMNYPRLLLAIVLMGIGVMALSLFNKIGQLERDNFEVSSQIEQLLSAKDQVVRDRPLLENQQPQNSEQSMSVEIKQLAMSLCDLAIAEGRYDLAERYTQIYGLSPEGYLDVIKERRNKQQAVQQKIQFMIKGAGPKEVVTETGILDQFIRFEPVDNLNVADQPIQQVLIHAYWSAEHGFIGWDLISKQILGMAEKVNRQDSKLAQQLKAIAQPEVGDSHV